MYFSKKLLKTTMPLVSALAILSIIGFCIPVNGSMLSDAVLVVRGPCAMFAVAFALCEWMEREPWDRWQRLFYTVFNNYFILLVIIISVGTVLFVK